MMRGVLVPWIRHAVALLIGWVTSLLVNAGLDAAALPEMESTINFLTLLVYFLVEKWLKPTWIRWFGESQPGEHAAPAPPKVL